MFYYLCKVVRSVFSSSQARPVSPHSSSPPDERKRSTCLTAPIQPRRLTRVVTLHEHSRPDAPRMRWPRRFPSPPTRLLSHLPAGCPTLANWGDLCRVVHRCCDANSTAASLLYPTYASYKALRPAASVGRSPADQAAHLERWLMFWCVMGCVALWEQWAEWGVSW